MMYPMYVHLGDENTAHGVTMPDFPGCYTAADSYEDLPKMVQEAVELHFDGEELPIPTPTPLEVLAKNGEYEGGTWMLFDIDLSRVDTSSKRINISMPQNLIERIDDKAKLIKLSRSAFLARAAEKELKEA